MKRIFFCIVLTLHATHGTPHARIYSLLKGWDYPDKTRDMGPRSILARGQFEAVWKMFCSWALSNGLKPTWQLQSDSGNMESWWLLRVEPIGKFGEN